MNEQFNPEAYREKINSLVNPALQQYQELLIKAGVPPESVVATISKVAAVGHSGLRKAERLVSLVHTLTEKAE